MFQWTDFMWVDFPEGISYMFQTVVKIMISEDQNNNKNIECWFFQVRFPG